MNDDSANISTKTWIRTVEPINKVGYSDGAADGQKSTFQTSFDLGYEQGFSFGLILGCSEAFVRFQKNSPVELRLNDPRRINCQICLHTASDTENIMNLFNKQKENNDEYLNNKAIK